MKKFTFTLLSAVLLCGLSTNVFGQSSLPGSEKKITKLTVAQEAEPTTNENQIEFSYATLPNPSYGVGTGLDNMPTFGMIEIPEQIAEVYNGQNISALKIGFGQTTKTKFQIFLTYDSPLEPFYTQDVELETIEMGSVQEIKLDTPYVIENKRFFIGYKFIASASDYPIGVDGIWAYDGLSDYLGYMVNDSGEADSNGQHLFFERTGNTHGSILIKAIITGEELPESAAHLFYSDAPTQVALGEPFTMKARLRNLGLTALETVGLSCKFGDGEPIFKTVNVDPNPWGYTTTGFLTIEELVCNSTGANLPVEIKITEINGSPCNITEAGTIRDITLCLSEGFKKNTVVEQSCATNATGTIDTEDLANLMTSKYPDGSLIFINAHVNDAMMCTEYIDLFITWPQTVVNRTTFISAYPTTSFEDYYSTVCDLPAVADVELSVQYANEDKTSLDIKASAEFSESIENGDYRFAFVLLEDNVGPYDQQNDYSYGWSGEHNGYETMPFKISMVYNNVARNIFDLNGIPESLPTNIEKGVNYEYSFNSDLSKVTNLSELSVVAMLINAKNGYIENATKINGPENTQIKDTPFDGVTIIGKSGGIQITGTYEELALFSLDGKLVDNAKNKNFIAADKGLYIILIKSNGTTHTQKVIVR